MFQVWYRVNVETVYCVRNFKQSAMNDIQKAINNEQTGVVAKLEDKFLIYKWCAIQIFSVDQKENTDFFPKGDNTHILNQAQGF